MTQRVAFGLAELDLSPAISMAWVRLDRAGRSGEGARALLELLWTAHDCITSVELSHAGTARVRVAIPEGRTLDLFQLEQELGRRAAAVLVAL